MYEELINIEETRRAIELKRYFVVKPAFTRMYNNINYQYKEIVNDYVSNPYNSSNEDFLSKDDLAQFLKKNKLFDEI
jgi:hypothetical protein